jgi:hypothetical protein
MGNGKSFQPLSPGKTGFFVGGNGKALIELMVNGRYAISASQNFGPLKTFQSTKATNSVVLLPNDRIVLLQLTNGQTRKQEHYWGSGFLSQSPGIVILNQSIKSVEVTNSIGGKRKLQ